MLAAPLSANDFCLYANASHIKAMISAKIISSMLCFPQFLKIPTFFTRNAEVTGAGAQRREPKAVRFWRPVDRLVSGRSPPRSPLALNAACPLPNRLHQPNGWRKEPERKPHQPDYHLNWTAPRLGHAMNTNTTGHLSNQTGQRSFRPWQSPE